MINELCRLTSDDLRRLSSALRTGRLLPPFSTIGLNRYVADRADRVSRALQHHVDRGFTPDQIAEMLDLVTADRAGRVPTDDAIELVWTGPESDGIANRDTSVVVRHLFSEARDSVLVAGYAVYQGQVIFRTLADRMDRDPHLRVTMFLDIQRPFHDTSSSDEIVRRFASRFKSQEWPGKRLPNLYSDPRSLHGDPSKRASLHAKCVVVDDEKCLVSSANFTEAAHLRNLEAGVLVRSSHFAKRLSQHFMSLVASGSLKRVDL